MDRDKIKDALDEINDIVCSCRNGKNGYISEIDLMDIQALLYDVYSGCELDCPDDVPSQSEQSNNAHKSVDLKPCPFCGGKAEIALHQERDDYGNLIGFPVYVACCDTCGAEVIGDPEKQKSADPEEMLRITKEAWNIRASDLIPCSERMPEKDGAYLCVSNGEFKILPYRNGEFYSTCFDAVLRCCNSSVTRWMPLPEPPKGV